MKTHEEESIEGGLAVYAADRGGLFVPGDVLWFPDAEQRFFGPLSDADESFTINCTVTPPSDVDKGWFMFFVTMLDQIYWVSGATLGALLGYVIQFDTTGIEFVMTALFVVMFVGQWEEAAEHRPALTGLGCSVICLLLFGSERFILPAMALIIVCFTVSRKKRDGEVAQ